MGSNLASYTAELGGKAPIVVFDDADVESAVSGAAFACFVASGQTCVSGTRLIVQEKIYDEFLKRFTEKTKQVNMGDPFGQNTDIGALVSNQQYEVRVVSPFLVHSAHAYRRV